MPKETSALEKRFTAVYQKGLWGCHKSGPGSGRTATAYSRRSIKRVIEELFEPGSCFSLIDAPCGDMTWMPLLLEQVIQDSAYRVRYCGIEIVQELVAENLEQFEGEPLVSYQFVHADLTRQAPPKGDMILCKDLVNHLVFSDIKKVIENFNLSGSTYLLISNNRGYPNRDVRFMRGNSSRHVNLEAPPFCFPSPLWSDGYLALWKLPVTTDWSEKL